MVRKSWKEWMEKGFPREADGLPAREYFRRGEDEWVRVPWEDAYDLVAQGMMNITESYSGEQGAEWLKQQGFAEEMVEGATHDRTAPVFWGGQVKGLPLLSKDVSRRAV